MATSNLEYLLTNGQSALPGYVSALPSMQVGIVVVVIIEIIGLIIALVDKLSTKTSNDFVEKYRWLAILLVTTYVAAMCFGPIQRKLYVIHNLKRNSQHFANVFWLKEYMEAFKLVNGTVSF